MSSSSSYAPRKCHCGIPLKMLKSWTNENPGRRFLTCKFSNAANKRLGCNYFAWVDENQSDWQRDVINRLMLDTKLLRCEFENVKAENKHLKKQSEKFVEEIELLRMKVKLFENESDMFIDKPIPNKRSFPLALYVFAIACVGLIIFKLLA